MFHYLFLAKLCAIFQKLDELGKKGVRVLGFVPDCWLPALYRHALAFVYPSIYEGFGLPPLEAMSYETPVIVSKSSSLPEVAGDAALYIDPHSIDSIQSAIENIVTDSILRSQLSKLDSIFLHT